MADPEKAINSEGNDADIEDTEEMEEEINKVQHNIDYSKNAEVLALLNSNMGDIAGSEIFIPCFPSPPKRIIKSLKKMQLECTKIEADFYKEVHTLECKYANLYAPFYEKRSQVITGRFVPTDEDCDFPSDVETDEELTVSKTDMFRDEDCHFPSDIERDKELPVGRTDMVRDEDCEFPSDIDVDEEFPVSKTDKCKDEDYDFPSDVDAHEEMLVEDFVKKANLDGDESEVIDSGMKGVPGFWLTIFRNVDMLADMIQDHDEPILQSLADVKVKLIDTNPMGFILEFHFEPNDYFTNDMLTKQYEMKCVVDENDPFNFDGPEICMCKGCKIEWKKGKNVTIKTIRKKQKHKQRGSVRTITKVVPNDSFFNFFNPPLPPDGDTIDEDTQVLLSADFEIGHFIRERLVPRAILFFTGEALLDLEEEEDDDDDLELEEEEERVQEEVEDKNAQKVPPAECKQQ